MTDVLNVFYETTKVGQLTRDREHIYSFAYDGAWLSSPERFPLSLAMPLQVEPFGNVATLSFFENLLPEGGVKDILSKQHKLNSPLGFLKTFGKDCAGAVIVTADSTSPTIEVGTLPETKLDMALINQAIDERQSVAAVVSEHNPGYLSVAGAQDKFPAKFRAGDLYLPAPGAPTTHIVKPPVTHSGIKESVFNEYFCMMLAQRVGLIVPQCFICDTGKYPLFVIERYDRTESETGLFHRLHQQDFCQAQGILSEEKYEAMGGPSLHDNYKLIVKHVSVAQRLKSALAFLDWVSFNLLIGNNDSHSKNIAFLMKENKIELAPYYDLLSTAIYPKLSRRFSFKIAGCDDASKIGPKQFLQLDQILGVKSGTFSKRVEMMTQKLLSHKEGLVSEMLVRYPGIKVFGRISNLIEKRCKGLISQGLTLTKAN
jgi:serine/threonine-protein kinase HipA